MRSKRTWIEPGPSYLASAIRMALLCGARITTHRKLPPFQHRLWT